MFITSILLILSQLTSIYSNTGLPIHKTHDGVLKKGDGSEPDQDIRLADFFWTGSGDGPPEYIKKVHTPSSDNGKEVIVKTETVVATVYIEGKNDLDTICLDCIRDTKNLPANYSTTDRRFWLLTVVGGFFQPRDYPMLEDKLAQLYRIAFTRQQSRHLGLINNNSSEIESDSIRHIRSVMTHTIRSNLHVKTEKRSNTKADRRIKRQINKRKKRNLSLSQPQPISSNTSTIPISSSESASASESVSATASTSQLSRRKFEELSEDTDGKAVADKKLISHEQQVRVIIHNVTLVTEEDLQNMENFYAETAENRNSRPLENQTEIIYSVFVGEKPILATTAAQDMKLVSQNEVSEIMEKVIFMKAEPYLREPLATPLVPATRNKTTSFVAIFSDNPFMIAIATICLLLVIILLVALLLMTRAKRRRSAEVKRLSSRQALLSETQTTERHDTTHRTVTDAATTSRHDLEGGVENHGYMHEQSTIRNDNKDRKGSPSINFPLPPDSRPGSSTTSTSDSSVYCPLNKPNIDLQDMLDRKAASLFEKKKRTTYSSRNEASYATIGRKRDKKSKTRKKRKYLNENRVGSIEEDKINSSQVSISSDSISDSFHPHYDHFEHNEAYNLNVVGNYHRNKVMQNRIFTERTYDTPNDATSPTQAINREILKVLQHGEKSSESGSVGSFLSMASVKSFPQNVLPEPLHRVLEPLSVTYYDHLDSERTIQRKPKGTKTVTLVDRYKKPHDEEDQPITGAQSDNPDTGVIGPIVWEIHKKRLTAQKSFSSPVHDPIATRNRFEGLLEGAIQMYSTNPDESPQKGVISGNDVPGVVRPKECRGKSAFVLRNPSGLSRSSSEVRPMTAGPIKCHSNSSTQPPSPNGKAWGSGAPSPLVRPLSAGPFHRPGAPIVDVTRVLVSQPADKTELSAAPLIEAIQNELKKFKRENSQ